MLALELSYKKPSLSTPDSQNVGPAPAVTWTGMRRPSCCGRHPSVHDPPPKALRHVDEEVGAAAPSVSGALRGHGVVPNAPPPATMAPVVTVKLERVEALELLGMTLAHLNDAEARAEMSPRVPMLMAIRDKLALALREEP